MLIRRKNLMCPCILSTSESCYLGSMWFIFSLALFVLVQEGEAMTNGGTSRVGRPRRRTAIDLFSGCGGLTTGLLQANFRVLAAVENDPLALETYRRNHSKVRLLSSDIRAVDPAGLMRRLKLNPGDLDLLAGCPPCQGFSAVRTLNGKRVVSEGRNELDARNDLVFEIARFAAVFRPKAILLENVPALARDPRIREVREALDKLGYRSDLAVLDAADYGVPQRRRRMILTAGIYGKIPPPMKVSPQVTVGDAIRDLPPMGASGDPLHDFPQERTPAVQARIAMIPKDGGGLRQMDEAFQLPCHRRCPGGFKDIYGRLWWDRVSSTITGGCFNPSKGRFIHPEADRAITLREAALLQTFPPDYWFSLERGKAGAGLLIGNALPPVFIRRHAETIRAYLDARGAGPAGDSGQLSLLVADGDVAI